MTTPVVSQLHTTNDAPLIVVGGGVRSGKSRLAVDLALARGERRGFIATAQAFDDEMRERIALHRQERQGRFETVEVPCALAEAAQRLAPFEVVVLDCLTLYVSNELMQLEDVERIERRAARDVEAQIVADVAEGVRRLREKTRCLIVVTNEVGMGVVPVSRLGRLFRDVAGRVNQWVAREATEVWWCALGLPLKIKPATWASETWGARE